MGVYTCVCVYTCACVGKMVVRSVKGFIQLIPDVGTTDVGANTGTLKLGVAVCTEQVLPIIALP